MIGCWAHARRKFVEALDEDRKHASEALVYIGRLYGIENEMQEAGLDAEAIRKRRQETSPMKSSGSSRNGWTPCQTASHRSPEWAKPLYIPTPCCRD